VDSDYRFFPTMRDATFDYVLHPVDLAMGVTGAIKSHSFIIALNINKLSFSVRKCSGIPFLQNGP